MKRIVAGYYADNLGTTLDGKPVEIEIQVYKAGKEWLFNIDFVGMHTSIPPGDYYPTKRKCLEAAQSCAKVGYRTYPKLVVCLNN